MRPPPSATTARPTARTSTARDRARLGRLGGERHRRRRQVAVGRLERGRPGRPARATIAAKRSAAAPLSSARSAAARAALRVGLDAAEHEQLRAQRERDLAQALVAGRAGEVVDRLAHLHRVAGRAAEHAVHVGEQRRGGQAVAAAPPPRSRARAPRPARGRAGRRPSRPSRPSRARRARRRASSTGSRRRSAGSTRPCRWRRGSRTGGGRPARAARSGPTIAAPALATARRKRVRARAWCRSPGSTRACRACRRCGRARAPRSSARRRRTRPRSAPAAGSPCRPRRRSSACRAPGRAGRRRTSRARRRSRACAPVSAIRSAGGHPVEHDRHRERAHLSVADACRRRCPRPARASCVVAQLAAVALHPDQVGHVGHSAEPLHEPDQQRRQVVGGALRRRAASARG